MQGMVDKIAMHVNGMPQWAVVALFLTIVLVVVKFVQRALGTKGAKHSKYFRNLDSKQDSVSKGLVKKRKSKKQQRVSEKKGESNNDFELTNPPTPTLENGEIRTIKKSEKRKNKSKKRKNQVESTLSNTSDVLEQEGEWHTVSTREERSFLKREKRKQGIEAPQENTPFPQTKPSIFNPTFTPTISSMAKEIAPRFARAAGEEWRENPLKRFPGNHPNPATPPIVTRSPMTSSVNTTHQATLTTLNHSIPDLWNNKGVEVTNSILGINSHNIPWNPISTNINGSNWNESTSATSWPLSPNNISPASWESSELQQCGSDNWSRAEDWVHISPTNSISKDWDPNNLTRGLRRWSGIRTGCQSGPPGLAQAMIQREEFLLEPEGLAVPVPDDPWNDKLDPENDVTGDWSPPEASWSNAIDEWNAPTANNEKKQHAYFDESSDDEKRQTSFPANNINGSATSSGNSVVVGAGPEMMSSVNQINNKKQRRRRRKKQLSQESFDNNDVTSKDNNDDMEQQSTEVHENQNMTNNIEADECEAWSIPKPAKKKKNRARRDE